MSMSMTKTTLAIKDTALIAICAAILFVQQLSLSTQYPVYNTINCLVY